MKACFLKGIDTEECGYEKVNHGPLPNTNDILTKINMKMGEREFRSHTIRILSTKTNVFDGLFGLDLLSTATCCISSANGFKLLSDVKLDGVEIEVVFFNSFIFCKAEFEGVCSGLCLLDTGSNICVLPQGKMQLKHVKLHIGPISKRVKCVYHNLDGLSAIFGEKVCGIIGWNFFDNLDLLIDWRRKKVGIRNT